MKPTAGILDASTLPRLPGSYALLLDLGQSHELRIGRLGLNRFPAGSYIYCGSAHGPGGLNARLGRHIDGGSRLHWHIDFLRTVGQVRCAWLLPGIRSDSNLECAWSQALVHSNGAVIPVRGFGASDCRSGCPAHLVRALSSEWIETLSSLLAQVAGVAPHMIMLRL